MICPEPIRHLGESPSWPQHVVLRMGEDILLNYNGFAPWRENLLGE